MPVHEWREDTDEGEVRCVRATRNGKHWTLEARLKSEPDWTVLSPPPLDDLQELRDVLWRKYQRGRVPHDHVLQLDAMIEEAGSN